jgi:hypothetical protein
MSAIFLALLMGPPVVLLYDLAWQRAKLRYDVSGDVLTLRTRVLWVITIKAVRENPGLRAIRDELAASGFFTWPFAIGTPGGGSVVIRCDAKLHRVILAFTEDSAALAAAIRSAMERDGASSEGRE